MGHGSVYIGFYARKPNIPEDHTYVRLKYKYDEL